MLETGLSQPRFRCFSYSGIKTKKCDMAELITTQRKHMPPWVKAVGIMTVVMLLIGFQQFLSGNQDPEILYETALAQVEANQFDLAQATLSRLQKARPKTPLDHGLWARVAMAKNRNNVALTELAAIPDDHGLASWARLRRGQLLRLEYRFRVAEEQFQAAIKIDPHLPEPRRELIYILGMQLRRTELHDQFRSLARLATLAPKEVWVWCMVRDLAWWIPEEHAPILEKALAADPGDTFSRLALAEVFRRTAQPDKALAELDKIDPQTVMSAVNKAEILIERDGPESAARLLAAVPIDAPGAAALRGRLALASGDAATAVRQLELAERTAPGRREVVSNLARAYALAGDRAKSRATAERAGKIDALGNLLLKSEKNIAATGPTDWRMLAQACEAAGRWPEARAWMSLVIQQNPLDQAAQAAIFQIDEAIKKESGGD